MNLKAACISARDGFNLPKPVQPRYFEDRFNFLLQHREALDGMMREPLFIDDAFGFNTVEQFAKWAVHSCETLIALAGKQVVAIAFLSPRGRNAEFLAWVHPQFRRGFRNQKIVRSFIHDNLFDYAFAKMGAVKIETRCALANRSAIAAAKNMKFSLVGVSRLDLLIQGTLFDSVLLELVNPAYETPPIEVRDHDIKAAVHKPAADPVDDEWADSEECDGAASWDTAGGESIGTDQRREQPRDEAAVESADYSEQPSLW